MARQLDSLVPRARGRPAIFSILFVSLFACSLASSSLQQQQQQQELIWRPVSSSSSPPQSAWNRVAMSSNDPGLLDNHLEPLYERPTVYAAPARAELPAGDEDDEQFLRQLKVAAEYLDEKLARRQREQQQRALLAKLGRFVDSSSPAAADSTRHSMTGQGPVYSLGGYDDDTGAPSGQETNSPVVIVAPSLESTRSEFSNSGSQLDSPNYRLLDALDSAPSQKAIEQQAAQSTYDNYKQLLQTLFSPDRAQPAAAAAAAATTAQGDEQLAATAVKRDESRSDSLAGDDREPIDERPRGKLTTLVEEDEAGDAPSSASITTEATTLRANETTTGGQQQSTSPAYGKVVYGQKGNASAAGAESSSSGSGVFSRMYAQLAHYLPFMNQINILRNPSTSSGDHNSLSGTTSRDRAAANGQVRDNAHNYDEHYHEDKKGFTVSVSRPKAKKHDQGEEEDKAQVEELHAKPSVSVSMAHQQQQHHEGPEEASGQGKDKSEDRDNQNDQDKQLRVKVSVLSKSRQHAGEDKSGEQKQQQVAAASGKSGNAKRLIRTAPDTGPELGELDMGQMMPVIIKPHAYSHLMRQPNQEAAAVAPGETDQLGAGGSLLGKYIYAPTQHYYLNSMLPTTASDHQQQQQQHQHQLLATSQQQARRFRPGDDVYGSYEASQPMKAAYAFQKDPSVILSGPGGLNSGLANKTNDLYFLVMVGAFCVMAMAVVLAAGAFAYRVQQSRKSSQEQDYPTYGVVGPNNMSGGGGGNGKCGASAFTMGGYFMGPPGGAGGASKSGSAKHLADLYGHPVGVNGTGAVATTGVNGGSDSGLNSMGRSSHSGNSAKKAASSSASSLNNPTEGQSARVAPGSFMSAASQDAARMYHYQHQKQQMIISDRNSTAGGRHTSASDLDSEDENDDGSYTVYECPGLASAHEMEIKNPLFNDDQTTP